MSTWSPAATSARSRTSALMPSMNLPPMDATLVRYVYPLIFTRTFGRLPDPRLSTTSSGTSTPVAVVPPRSIVARNLIGTPLLGAGIGSNLARWRRRRERQA